MKSIYVITNLVNNKRYVGQTYCPANRKRDRECLTCSKECAARRTLSNEIQFRFESSQCGTKIAADLNVSYKTVCRIRKDIRMN